MHTEFTLERRLKTSPRHAFRFWSDKALKARWNDCHTDWILEKDEFDFRVGGNECKHWRTPEGQRLTFTAHYFDIVPAERIIYAYEMSLGENRFSASLVTITLVPSSEGTRMLFTEQAAILEGGADAIQQRRQGTEEGMDRLVELVKSEMGVH
jgi:uncharacterized protein YndB with AHSA1/START domain